MEPTVPDVDPTLRDIEEAAALLEDVALTTPVEYSSTLGELAGTTVALKCENLQRTGSFKLRGAYVRLARLTAAERARGVVAASAGNHAQGVALAATELGIRSMVYMPADAALPKVAATRGYGAEVRQHGADLGQALQAARAEAERSGAIFVHPFDHPDVILGQATLGLELLRQLPEVGTILVPTGGGGLLAGVALAVRAVGSPARVIGVQADGAATFANSLRAGHPVSLERTATMADGIAVPQPGVHTLDVVRRAGAEIVTVSEQQLARAILLLAERAKIVAEPAGAAGVAALLDAPPRLPGPIAVVVSGGNIDPLVLQRVLHHGLVGAGRFIRMRVRMSDRPGALASMLRVVAATGANVVMVDHARTAADLALDEVDVRVEAETKGPEHREHVVAALRDKGYGVITQHEMDA